MAAKELRALKVLEFQAIRDRLAAHCQTETAAELALDVQPLFDTPKIWSDLKKTKEAYDLLGRSTPPNIRAGADIRDSVVRAGKGVILGGKELYEVGRALEAIRLMQSFIATVPEIDPESEERTTAIDVTELKRIAAALVPQPKVEDSLLYCLEADGALKDSASPELSSLRSKKKSAVARVLERVQAYTTGKQRDLLSDPIYTVRDGRYVIPLKSENRGKIKGIVHGASSTGQTIFLEPQDVLDAANHVREVESAEAHEEQRILKQLSGRIGTVSAPMIGSIDALTQLDLIFAKARLAYELRSSFPEPNQGEAYLEFEQGRHPLLETDTVVPISVGVGKAKSVLITGPNTGGKTVAIKTVGLFVAMLQSGLAVPAAHVKFAPFSQIWADIGDEQSIAQSLSTFSGHIKNIASALNLIRSGSLVLLDEIGAGTDPAEGAALARAVLETFHEAGAAIMASTHYGELKVFAFTAEGFRNASMEFDTKTLRPTYKLVMGAAGASQALKIAQRYGIEEPILDRAKSYLTDTDRDLSVMLQNLENAQKLARNAQAEADKRGAELQRLQQEAEKRIREAEEARKRANARAQEAIDGALRDIRIQADDLLEKVKKSGGAGIDLQKARKDFESLDSKGKDLSGKFRAKEKANESAGPAELAVGDQVTIMGYTQPGVVLEIKNARDVIVQAGPIKMTVQRGKLTKVEKKMLAAPSQARMLSNAKANTVGTEIHLRNMRAEEAKEKLEKAVDDALLAGIPFLRIVHGKGDGILRKVTQDYLKAHRDVKRYRNADPAEGGEGVTIAEF